MGQLYSLGGAICTSLKGRCWSKNCFAHFSTQSFHCILYIYYDNCGKRGQVFRELVEWFKQDRHGPDFTTDTITFDVILPNGDREQGQDAGVVRDVLSEFWEDFYEQCTTGNKAKVPCLRHDFDQEDWTSVAHVIAMGWILQDILPLRLAPSFLESCLFGLHNENMRDEFFNFISPSERKILTEALEDFNQVDMGELIDVLSDHGCKVQVTRENIETVIDQIATTEMIQTPAFVKECFFGVLMGYGLDIDLQLQYQRTTPTSRRIISIMDCDDPEADAYNYLRKYVREIEGDEKMLRNFLRFVTGSDLLLSGTDTHYHRITVSMVDLDGLSRRPVAHTCGRILELPKKYENYPIFRCEMNAILNSNIWVMDLV